MIEPLLVFPGCRAGGEFQYHRTPASVGRLEAVGGVGMHLRADEGGIVYLEELDAADNEQAPPSPVIRCRKGMATAYSALRGRQNLCPPDFLDGTLAAERGRRSATPP